MAASWAVIWDSVCDFLHGKSQALSEGSAVKPAIRGSPEWPPHGQLFGTAYATFFTESRRHLARGAQLNRPFVAARRILKSFTARLKSCPDTKQSLPQPGYPVVDLLSETPESRYVFSAGGLVFERSAGLARPIRVIMDV